MERYHRTFADALATIDREAKSSGDKLRRYAGLYDSVMRNDRMCLCGMLAAEHATLPEAMRMELLRFFKANESWLADVLDDGRQSGEFSFRGTAKGRARSLLGALEGALLVARAYGDDRPLPFGCKTAPRGSVGPANARRHRQRRGRVLRGDRRARQGVLAPPPGSVGRHEARSADGLRDGGMRRFAARFSALDAENKVLRVR